MIAPKHVWARVDTSDPNACWRWPGGHGSNGYGTLPRNMKIDGEPGRINYLAHRVAYQMAYGPIRKSDLVCHRCDVRDCINPRHLFTGSHKDNTQDMLEKGRHAYGVCSSKTKYDAETVRQIKQYQGTHREAATAFNANYFTVYGMRTGITWEQI